MPETGYKLVPEKDIKSVITSSVIILDVRCADEYQAAHLDIPASRNPRHEFSFDKADAFDAEDAALRHGLDHDTPIYILCAAGKRAAAAAEKFVAAGFKEIYVIAGGMGAVPEEFKVGSAPACGVGAKPATQKGPGGCA